MAPQKTLVDWLDDLCVRFIVNLPNEELQSVERICFQIEEAQWFYEDFIRPLDPNKLPTMHLRKFSQLMFQHCPLFSAYSEQLHQQAYEQFLAYKTRVPVRGAIMLNEDMTQAVLVKGWKKTAKWSFPRGKINKEETDLDCAVREVWEETGFDLRTTDLVKPEEQMKSIPVTMREQNIMLYVFRGVPMDTYFEPRTRKEISKIDWYKLTDLPAAKRKNQVQQQGAGQGLIKESNFYMVAPFLGPLRVWIKQQHKLDKQRARSSAYLAPPPVAITDDEDIQPELYETTADEAAPVAEAQSTDNFADLVARLGQGHRPSDTLPEVSIQHQIPQTPQQSSDPATELKRLLSVGVRTGVQSPPVEAPSVSTPSLQQQANPLLALFSQGNGQPGGSQIPVPRTPFDQVMSAPVQPSSPHGQHHARPPEMNNMGPPPPFFSSHQNLPFRGPPQQFDGMLTNIPPGYMPPQLQQRNLMFPPQPNMQQSFDQRNPRPFQDNSDSQFGGDHGRPVIPPASKLPAPNLNPHTLGLLNSFKIKDQKPAPSSVNTQTSSQVTPRVQHPQQTLYDLASPRGLYAPSPPQFQSPPVSSSFRPEQPKPRTTHQDSLLTLFRSTPPLASPEPAELSAYPLTPGYVSAQPVANPSRLPNSNLLDAFGPLPTKTGITSATVSGPDSAPDFETMKKHTHPVSGSSRGPSPSTQMPFMPQQILKRAQVSSAPRSPVDLDATVRNGTPQTTAQVPHPSKTAFKPQILKRPQQNIALAPVPRPTAHAQGLLDMFKGPSPQPAHAQPARSVPSATSPAPSIVPQVFTRSESKPSDSKNALLALFGKASPGPESHRSSLPQTHSPAPPTRSPFPPTPKMSMSGIISPVSPLPANGSQTASPADLASRSRISSIGDAVAPTIAVPPTSHPAHLGLGAGEGQQLGGADDQPKDRNEGKSPVDKTFLLGFLEDVARRGR